MALNWTLPLRGVQLLFGLLVLILSAVGVNKFGGVFSALNFLLFCGLFSLLSLAYLLTAPSFFAAFHHIYAILVLEFLNMIFFFSGFIAVAAIIGGVPCESSFLGDFRTACQTTKAATAFGAFSWLLWLATLILVVRQVYLEHQGSVSRNGVKSNEPVQMTGNDAGAV